MKPRLFFPSLREEDLSTCSIRNGMLKLIVLMLSLSLIAAMTIEEGAFNSFASVGKESSSNDEPAHIAISEDETLIVAGTSSPLERGTESDLGLPLNAGLKEEDFFLSKVDGENGTVLWVYRGGTSKEDRVHALLMDKSGRNIYIGGRTFGQFPGTKRKGQSDIFILKYDISGDKPRPVWQKPLILGTTASDAVTALAFDPKDENLIYGTGFTSGNLFPGKSIDSSKLSDAILFSFSASEGTLVHKQQFGTNFADQGTGIVISDKVNGPVFVSVITDRQIGQYAFGNFHMYKFKRDATPLGDLLLRTYSREQMTSFREHPMLPGTLIGSGSSWLDSRNGYDIFVKRIVRVFDNSEIGSKAMDIDEVSDEEYTKRLQSPDGSHDYASGMLVDPESGRLVISGYTAGAFAPDSKKDGHIAPFIASVDPLDASLTDAKQMTLNHATSWVEIACITMSTGQRGLYYVAKKSNVSTNHFHLDVGTFGFPAPWKTIISIAPSPPPTPSPKTDNDKNNPAAKKRKVPVAIIAGSVAGGLALLIIIAAIIVTARMRRRSRAAKVYDPQKRPKKPATKAFNEKNAPVDGPKVEGSNASGLV